MQEWVMRWWCFSVCLRLPALHDNSAAFVLQLLNAQTPMCWSMETSPLLRRSTLCTMKPCMSATLDTHCEAHPHVFACQTASGAGALQSVAETVSPEQQPSFFLLPPSSFSFRFEMHPHSWRFYDFVFFFYHSRICLWWSWYSSRRLKSGEHLRHWRYSEIYLQWQPVFGGVEWKSVSGERPVDRPRASMLL